MSVVVLALEVRLVLRMADDPIPPPILGHGVLNEVGGKLASALRGKREYISTGGLEEE
jgi:hypothetical protein